MAVLSVAAVSVMSGSGVAGPVPFAVLLTLTRFAIVLPGLALTLTLTVRELVPTARSPRAQLIGPPLRGAVQVPFVVVTATNDVPEGIGFDTANESILARVDAIR